MFPKWSDWNIEYTRKGLLKLQIQRALRVLAFIFTIYAAYTIRRDVRGGLKAFREVILGYVRRITHGILGGLDRGVSRVVG